MQERKQLSLTDVLNQNTPLKVKREGPAQAPVEYCVFFLFFFSELYMWIQKTAALAFF